MRRDVCAGPTASSERTLSESPLFIAMEGTDGSGTTTQGDMLAEALRRSGRTVLRTAEPSGGEIGALIRRELRGQTDRSLTPQIVALLFAADRIAHCQDEIGPALARGEFVVCDRYLASSLSFQVVDGEGGITTEWLRSINRPIIEPDISLLFDVPTEVTMARIDKRGRPKERFEKTATLLRVRRRYLELFADPNAGLGKTTVINGDRSREEIAYDALGQVMNFIGERAQAAAARLQSAASG